jgi:hypothetical protein
MGGFAFGDFGKDRGLGGDGLGKNGRGRNKNKIIFDIVNFFTKNKIYCYYNFSNANRWFNIGVLRKRSKRY